MVFHWHSVPISCCSGMTSKEKSTKGMDIPTRKVIINDPSELPEDYGTTPGGTIFSTTPGGDYSRPSLIRANPNPC